MSVDYLVHTILFLPWMFFSAYSVEKQNTTGKDSRSIGLGGWKLASKEIRLPGVLLWLGLGLDGQIEVGWLDVFGPCLHLE